MRGGLTSSGQRGLKSLGEENYVIRKRGFACDDKCKRKLPFNCTGINCTVIRLGMIRRWAPTLSSGREDFAEASSEASNNTDSCGLALTAAGLTSRPAAVLNSFRATWDAHLEQTTGFKI